MTADPLIQRRNEQTRVSEGMAGRPPKNRCMFRRFWRPQTIRIGGEDQAAARRQTVRGSKPDTLTEEFSPLRPRSFFKDSAIPR